MTDTASLSNQRPRRDAMMAALKALEPELKTRGVGRLYLFGSVARDDAAPGSDVDLFFDDQGALLSLSDLLRVRHYLEDTLNQAFDLIPRDSLSPFLKDEIEASARQVF